MKPKRVPSRPRRRPIEPKASLLIVNDGKILLSRSMDGSYVRPPGGHIEYFEHSKTAVRREIMEEISSGISDLRLEKVVENLFHYRGRKLHDIYFIYSGTLTNKALYTTDPIAGDENGDLKNFYWIKVSDILSGKERLVPGGLLGIVARLNRSGRHT